MEQFISQMKHLSETIQQVKSDMMTYFDIRVDPILSTLNGIQGSLSTLGKHVSELERVAANEDNLNDLSTLVKQLEKQNSYLKYKVDDLENRSRSANLRIIRVPESSEGRNMLGFMARFIPQLGRKTSTLRRLLRGLIASLQSARMTAPARGPS